MSLSPLSFVVVVGIETNKGKLLSLLLLGLQLVSIYHVFFGPESVSDRKKGSLSGNSDRIFGPEFVLDRKYYSITRLESSGDSDWSIFRIEFCFGTECISQTGIIIIFVSDQNLYRNEIIINFVFSDRNIYILDRNHHQGSLLYFKGVSCIME